MQGIPRSIFISQILPMELKRNFRKGCQIYASYMGDIAEDREPIIVYQIVLEEFEYVFTIIIRLPTKGDIDFSIDMAPRASQISKSTYLMSHQKIKNFK